MVAFEHVHSMTWNHAVSQISPVGTLLPVLHRSTPSIQIVGKVLTSCLIREAQGSYETCLGPGREGRGERVEERELEREWRRQSGGERVGAREWGR